MTSAMEFTRRTSSGDILLIKDQTTAKLNIASYAVFVR